MSILAPESIEHSSPVVEALETTRRAMGRYRAAMALVAATLAMIATASVVAVADVSWVLPIWVRAIGLVGVVLVGLGLVAKSLMGSGRKFGRAEAASEVESAFPELGQRVRTTLEYSDPSPTTAPASPTLIGALVEDTARRASWLDFPAVVPWPNFKRNAIGLTAAILGVIGALAYEPALRIAARRLFLLPAYYTTIAVDPGDKTLKEGAEFQLKATLGGRPVPSATWLQRPAGSQEAWTSTSLAHPTNQGEAPRPLVGILEASRKDCRADFEYRVVAGEVESPVYRVSVTHPLTIQSYRATIEPPAYTRLPPSVAKEGNFRAPEGSKVRFEIALERSPRSARIAWTPEGSKTPQVLPLTVEGTKLSGELPPLTGDVRYELVAEAADGMKLDPARFLIKVQPDEKPTVKFLKPDESLAVTPTTEVPMKVVASDDYGVAKLGIVFQINDGPEETLYLEDPKDQSKSVEALATLFLEQRTLSYTDSVTYRAFVEDNRTPEPHRVSTDLRFIDIMPYKKAFQLASGGGGSGDGTSVSLEELIARQRRTLNRTFAHQDDRPVDPKVTDKLSKDEAELAFATGDFAKALASRFGPISPLDHAAKAMEMATASLASGDLAASILQEQAALASLIKARQNLRKLLSDSKSASLARSIDRQEQQKIRKPPAEKSKDVELANLEAEIRKLGEQQKKFAEEIEPKGGSGAEAEKQNEPKSGPSPAERQQASAKEAQRLNALAREDQALTDLARDRMKQASEEVKQSEEAIRADRQEEAAASAKSAAEQLERLADHVAGLKAKELAARIAKARDLAQATGKGETDLAKAGKDADPDKTLAEHRELAEDAKTVSDLLRKLKYDSVDEDRTLAQAVAKAAEENSPAEIEQAMQQASAALASGERAKSTQSMNEAAEHLGALAKDLEAARREFMQPKLQQLLATEKKAAEVQKALESATDEARKAEAEKGLSELARAVDSLKSGDGPLQKAGDALDQAVQGVGSTGWTPPQKRDPKTGLHKPPVPYTNAVRAVSQALQTKIQEMILNDALVDRDGAVPPGYKEKVESYFRVLSEDLR